METGIQTMARTAKEAGVPRDQLERFLKYKYVPLKWQMKLHALARECDKPDGPIKLGAGGARGPGKSRGVFAQLTLDDCQRVKGLKCLFLRQTGRAAQESFGDLILASLTGKVDYEYSEHKGLLKFPRTNSRILLGGFKDEKDIDSYIGIEYDVIAVEEVNQLTQKKVDMLEGSLRTSKPNWRPRLYTSFNPGGIGHQFVKKTFVNPYRRKEELKTRFIPSTYKDNPYLNKEYIDYLEGLEGALGKAWREGNFDTFEGQFFQEWDYKIHTCQPFKIPVEWRRFIGYDHGRAAPACCKWYALDHDGRVWVYRELYVTEEWEADRIALEIRRLSQYRDDYGQWQPEQIAYKVADSSIFSQHGHGETIAEVFARNGVSFIPSSKDRVAGWDLMHSYLRWDNHTLPKIIYFNTCLDSIRTIPDLIHDERIPEDLDTRGEDHGADTDRYFLQTLRAKKTQIPLTGVEKKVMEIKKKDEGGQYGGFNPSIYE